MNNTLHQKALAWEAFRAGALEQRADGAYVASLTRRFPKEAALEKLKIDEALRLAFEAWWKTYRAHQAASRRPQALRERRSP